jgi:ribosomal protein S18 acetylase RimI-like enzyme
VFDSDIHGQVAGLHIECISQGFLSSLGASFLAQLYAAIDQADGARLLVAKDNGRVVGFVSGADGMRPIYRQMIKHPIHLTGALLPSAIRPARLTRMLEILRYGSGSQLLKDLPVPELLSLAVSPDVRGQGIAERLYRELIEHFRSLGKDGFRIVVGSELAPAHRFYRRMGAVAVSEIEVHKDLKSMVYVQHI